MINPTAQAAVQAGSPEHLEQPFRREHGIHTFTTQKHTLNNGNGDLVSVVSQPDWESFYDALSSVDPNSDILVSPELITAKVGDDGLPDLSSISAQQKEIERRIKEVGKFAGDNPDMVVTLSTPTFNGGNAPNGARKAPASSFLFFNGGAKKPTAQNNQQFAPSGMPERWLSLDQVRGGRTPRMYLSGIVGVDFVAEASGQVTEAHIRRPIGRFTKTVLVSGGVTLSRGSLQEEGASAEEVAEGHARELMAIQPDISDIIIAGRIPNNPNATGDEGPLNAHFVRQPE